MLHHIQLSFKEQLSLRSATKYIILHHTEVMGRHDVREIHQWHLNKNWAGIGYHYYIDKDGDIYTGRPVMTVGAHTKGYNAISIGICFEGNFDKEQMSEQQLDASILLLSILSLGYHNAAIRGHRDFNTQKTCPGTNFPMKELLLRIQLQKKRFIRLYGDPESIDYDFLLKQL